MGVISALFGVGASAVATKSPVEAIGAIIDDVVTTDEERANAEIIKYRIFMQPQLAQAAINKVEAQHRSIFVAGWRPFVGWVCGLSLFYNHIGHSLIEWFVAIMTAIVIHFDTIGREFLIVPPKIPDEALLIEVLLGLLGIGALRTFEKIKGVSK